jgi:hypothetical protein
VSHLPKEELLKYCAKAVIVGSAETFLGMAAGMCRNVAIKKRFAAQTLQDAIIRHLIDELLPLLAKSLFAQRSDEPGTCGAPRMEDPPGNEQRLADTARFLAVPGRRDGALPMRCMRLQN